MGFADELDAVASNNRLGRPPRLFDRIIADFDEKDGDALREAIADLSVSPAAIWRVLCGRGYDVSRSSVADWCRQARAGK